ncbi:hypothetical protein MIND_01153800 [Mycena indigotica]|uniref:FAD-binding domain-containing protein n=1 Tax=Mycena indigotica TaxID=2126181 RepID=A0A8H6S3L4_9AGAR|nr:uncharacterized protein MIND_01153800 [Mycena indigotica]KAF7292565.1 hypothetical protein MIND_01153800 [Mycena indigotica]
MQTGDSRLPLAYAGSAAQPSATESQNWLPFFHVYPLAYKKASLPEGPGHSLPALSLYDMTSQTKRLSVAISGGGIAGLTLALALSEYPEIEVHIFEAAHSLAEVGAGVAVFPRPWSILRRLGVDEELIKTCDVELQDGPSPSFHYRKSNQAVGLQFATLVTTGTCSMITLYRADFQAALLGHLPDRVQIHYSKRLHSFDDRQPGPVQLVFSDGTAASCDILVGADGLKSATRAGVLARHIDDLRREGREDDAAEAASCIEPWWSGHIAYRALIPKERLREVSPNHQALTEPMQYLGKNGYIIAYPISHGKIINIVAFDMRHDLENTKFDGPWVQHADKEHFTHIFANWEPEVQALVNCAENPLAWAIHTVKPMHSFVSESGRVALIGDAAHAMTPHQGSGAGQAVEDAYILARILGHPSTTVEKLPRALRIFDQVRRPAAQHVGRVSRLAGRYFSFELDGTGKHVDFAADFGHAGVGIDPAGWEILQQIYKQVEDNWRWAWTTSVDDVEQEVVKLLEDPEN